MTGWIGLKVFLPIHQHGRLQLATSDLTALISKYRLLQDLPFCSSPVRWEVQEGNFAGPVTKESLAGPLGFFFTSCSSEKQQGNKKAVKVIGYTNSSFSAFLHFISHNSGNESSSSNLRRH
nr:hypothetical protein Iba_chr14dCG8930 [Ipomoea batatas]